MDTITISSKTEIPLEGVRKCVSERWSLLPSPSDRIAIQDPDALNSRIYIHHAVTDARELVTNEIWIDYSSLDFVKKVVESIADNPEWMVDNETEDPLPGDKFVARLRSEADWNWRLIAARLAEERRSRSEE